MEAWQCGFVVQFIKEFSCKLYLRSQLLAILRKLAQVLSCCACAFGQVAGGVLECLFIFCQEKNRGRC